MLTALALSSLLVLPQDPQEVPSGFRSLFDGTSFEGWWELEGEWSVSDGCITSDGSEFQLYAVEELGDFELRAQYRLVPFAYGGISLRKRAFVEIWDVSVPPLPGGLAFSALNDGPGLYPSYKGSGGLRDNARWTAGHDPLVVADRKPGEWNDLRLVIVGQRLSVWLNDTLVLDHVNAQNRLGSGRPFPRRGLLGLACSRGPIRWRNLFVRDVGPDERLELLAEHDRSDFAAISTASLADWTGVTSGWRAADGVLHSAKGASPIRTTREFGDFTIRLEVRASEGAGGSLILRSGEDGGGAPGAIEIPILGSDTYEAGSGSPLHDAIASRAALIVEEGAWNSQEVTFRGGWITVELNGFRVLDGQVPPGAIGANDHGPLTLVADRAGLSVRNVLVREHGPPWPSLEPFMAARFWETVPAFSGVELGSRHTPDTLKAAAKMAALMRGVSQFAEDAADSLATGEEPAFEEPGDTLGYHVAPIVMHALAPLWDDATWDANDRALAQAGAALLARLPDEPAFEFVDGDDARNHETLGAVARWFRARVSDVPVYAAMIYTLDDGPWRPVAVETDAPRGVAKRLPVGPEAELRLLADRPGGSQVLEVARGDEVLHRVLLEDIPGQLRLTFDKVPDALALGPYGWRVQMRFGVPRDMEKMTLYLDPELRPLFYFTSW